MILYIIFILIIILIFFISNKYIFVYNEYYSENIIFLNNDELFYILKNDNDNYYKSFFKNDFYSRNIKNINEYIIKINDSVHNFNNNQKEKIRKCIKIIDNLFIDIKIDWFNGIKANKIQWKIGCVKGKLYEHGLPHTRDDIIIISSNDIDSFTEKKLIKTLIHEKIHLYQKIHNNDVEKYLLQNNFKKYKKREFNDNIRANPDLDNWIYQDNENNLYKAVYNDNPTSVEDIKYMPFNTQKSEHPFEKMAIEMEKYYL